MAAAVAADRISVGVLEAMPLLDEEPPQPPSRTAPSRTATIASAVAAGRGSRGRKMAQILADVRAGASDSAAGSHTLTSDFAARLAFDYALIVPCSVQERARKRRTRERSEKCEICQ